LTFTFIDIILFLGISQGVFLAAALRLLHNRNRHANHILSLTLLFAVLMLLGRILVFKIQGDWIGPLAILVDTTIFLFTWHPSGYSSYLCYHRYRSVSGSAYAYKSVCYFGTYWIYCGDLRSDKSYDIHLAMFFCVT